MTNQKNHPPENSAARMAIRALAPSANRKKIKNKFSLLLKNKEADELLVHMSKSVHEQSTKIKEEAEASILALKQEAASGIAKALYVAKEKVKEAQAEVDRLAREYATATGKTITGEKAPTVRRRLSAEEKSQLKGKLLNTIKAKAEGVKLSDLRKASGESTTQIRKVINELLSENAIQRTGEKSTTVYTVAR